MKQVLITEGEVIKATSISRFMQNGNLSPHMDLDFIFLKSPFGLCVLENLLADLQEYQNVKTFGAGLILNELTEFEGRIYKLIAASYDVDLTPDCNDKFEKQDIFKSDCAKGLTDHLKIWLAWKIGHLAIPFLELEYSNHLMKQTSDGMGGGEAKQNDIESLASSYGKRAAGHLDVLKKKIAMQEDKYPNCKIFDCNDDKTCIDLVSASEDHFEGHLIHFR